MIEDNYKIRTKEYYAKHSENYPIKTVPWRLNLLKKNNSSEKSILELGCGIGNYLLTLPNINVVGIDLSMESVEVLKKRPEFDQKKFNIMVGDITEMPFGNEEFDLAYSFSTLYYIKEIDLALKEIYRVMKYNGICILEFGNKYSVNSPYDKIMFPDCPQFHYSENEIRKILSNTGFIIKEILYRQLLPDFLGLFDRQIKLKFIKNFCFRLIFVVQKVDQKGGLK